MDTPAPRPGINRGARPTTGASSTAASPGAGPKTTGGASSGAPQQLCRRPAAGGHRSSARLHPLAAVAVPAAIAATVLLAACGASGSDSPSNAAANERAQEQKAETRFADFAKCLREHGMNAEAISHPGGGHGLKVSPGSGGPGAMEAAEKACARYRPEPKKVNLSPQQKVELEEGAEKFAKCMREHGIKVETTTEGGGIQIGIHARVGSGQPNPESPAFQQAQSACQKLLPKPPGSSGAGPFAAARAGG